MTWRKYPNQKSENDFFRVEVVAVNAGAETPAYTPQNSADIRRATQAALRLEAQAEVENTEAAWRKAAHAWLDAQDSERAAECRRRARG